MTVITFSVRELTELARAHEDLAAEIESVVGDAVASSIGNPLMYGLFCGPIAVPVLAATHLALSGANVQFAHVLRACAETMWGTVGRYTTTENECAVLADKMIEDLQ